MPEYTPEQIEGQGYKNTTQDIIDLLKSSVDFQTGTMLEYEEAETILAALKAAEKERDALVAYATKLEKTGDAMCEYFIHVNTDEAKSFDEAKRIAKEKGGHLLTGKEYLAIHAWDAARKEKP